jgi:deoxyribodipyrimidine photo-lyase
MIDPMLRPHPPPAIPAPARAAALARLDAFVREGLREYAWRRNHDAGPDATPTVSLLSPHVRHRLVLESELVRAARRAYPGAASEKFVQEVFWRSYWKGWLELRPRVWRDYRAALERRLDEAQREPLASRYADACAGRTGIDCFDAWVRELVTTGYLHNHVRMWFASIWSHTLRLPWELGADFFLRQLLDGDAASNTLSWRWVVGLQTPGKIYLARADNIAKYTNGRWSPRGLATDAAVPAAERVPAAGELPPAEIAASTRGASSSALDTARARTADAAGAGALLLLHEDDLHPESLGFAGAEPICVFDTVAGRSPMRVSDRVHEFTRDAQRDALARLGANAAKTLEIDALVERCTAERIATAVTPYAPTGPARDRLDALEPVLRANGIALRRVRRELDVEAWPLAKRGFFAFAEHIPRLASLAAGE